MKDIYYCTKIDNKGNKLTSSYTSKKYADQYGKGCTVKVALMKADFSDPRKLVLCGVEASGPIIRGLLTNNNPSAPTEKGDFVIWGKSSGIWADLGLSFSSYSAANGLMKAMIGDYQAMAVLDTKNYVDSEDSPSYSSGDASMDDVM
jgi:hypothetical protein